MIKPRLLDLFSGIGGFSLGMERAGFETVAFCEKSEFCRRVLVRHWPGIPIIEDIKHLRGDEFGELFAAVGGFPCTQTSVGAAIHGKRSGLEGADSGLWYEYMRVVRTGRPIWVIVENPGGVIKWESEIQGGLEGAGYRVSRLEITASDCGLPHLRRRYFYVANRDGKGLEIAGRSKSPSIDWFTRLASSGGDWLKRTPGIIGEFTGLKSLLREQGLQWSAISIYH